MNERKDRTLTNEFKDGYRVIIGSFVLCLIVDGITYSYGVLMLELLTAFQTGRGETALVGSLLAGCFSLTGPFAGFMCETFGFRPVIIAGSLISTLGFVGATFATQLFHLYILYGFVAGIGFGMMLLAANSCIIMTFTRNVSLASGIAVCGSGVGNFIISHLTRLLADEYGWRGAVLIQGGITLHGVVCGLLMGTVGPVTQIRQELIIPDPLEDLTQSYDRRVDNDDRSDAIGAAHDLSKDVTVDKSESAHSGVKDKQSENIDKNSVNVLETISYNVAKNEIVHEIEEFRTNRKQSFNRKTSDQKRFPAQNKTSKSTIYKSDENTHNVTLNNDIKTTQTRGKLASMCDRVFDIKLLSTPKFLVVLVAIGFASLAFWVPFHLIPDQADAMNISRQMTTWIMSSIGISNTLGRVIFGALGNIRCVRRTALMAVLLLFLGITTGLSPFLTSFGTKLIYGCCFGLLIGGFFALLPVVMADLFGSSVISRTFGLTMFTIGIFASVATPIGGWIRDSTGSYAVSFLVAGGEFIAGSVALLIAMFLK